MGNLSLGEFLDLNGRRVPLVFLRNPRAKRYVLRLRPGGIARITIPRGGSAAEAHRFAERNRQWIERQLQKQAAQPSRPKTWTIGTVLLFRGEPVPIEAGTNGEMGMVRLGNEKIRVPFGFNGSLGRISSSTSSEPGSAQQFEDERQVPPEERISHDLRPLVERHLWRLAAVELPPRVLELAAAHQLRVQRVTVRNQRSRWGSCSRRGAISLNWRIIQAPPFVRDYLILHELSHLREMNHSLRFWREVERVCPGYQAAERWLKLHASLLRPSS